ncbi:MAG: T9SS type A sorting domain-containing protein [Ignavibacteriales bacterium]
MFKHIFSVVFLPLFILLPGLQALAQYTNVRINKSQNQPEEVSIAINPLNPLNLVAGANIDNYYYSTDGGKSWTEGRLTSGFGVYGDPSLTFDSLGNVYYAHLSSPPSDIGYWIDRIVVQRSSDGGKSWTNGAGVGYAPPVRNQDKEWIIADNSGSKFRNSIYMAWTQFDKYGSKVPGDSSRIMFSRSLDQGATWSAPIIVSDSSGDCLDGDNTVEGAVPAVGPNGEVYLGWAGPSGIKFDRSLDGGLTFGKDIYVTSQPGGWDFDVEGIYRCNGMPVTVCDISNSIYRGNIYINWADQRNGTTNTDVFITRSVDGGNSWSTPIKVNGNTAADRDQFFSWAAVDPVTGYLWIVYYDRSQTAGVATDVFVARSKDGGATFTNFKVSDSAFSPIKNVFFGDYTNIAAFNGRIFPIWMRLDGSFLSIWTALVEDVSSGSIEENTGGHFEYFLFKNYPNPFNPVTKIDYSLAKDTFVSLRIYDSLGKEIQTLVNDYQSGGKHSIRFDGSRLSSGLYFYRLVTHDFNSAEKMVLIK